MSATTNGNMPSAQASAEMLKVRQAALMRQRINRGFAYFIAILICLWVLIPIWFIASMALTTPAYVRAYPKGVLPFIPFSFDTMRFFLNSQGIIPGTINSIIVALITLVLSTIIAAPAGYATSRYIFRGRDTYRLSILAVRAFPVVILAIPLATVFISLGIYDSVYSLALMHTALTLPTTILVIGSVFASIPYELEEAAQGGLLALPGVRILGGGPNRTRVASPPVKLQPRTAMPCNGAGGLGGTMSRQVGPDVWPTSKATLRMVSPKVPTSRSSVLPSVGSSDSSSTKGCPAMRRAPHLLRPCQTPSIMVLGMTGLISRRAWSGCSTWI